MTIDHEAFAEANQPPPARVVETPERGEATEAPGSVPGAHLDYGLNLRRPGLVDLDALEKSVTEEMMETFAAMGLGSVEWKADRSHDISSDGRIRGFLRFK